jgi:hypothetical protein
MGMHRQGDRSHGSTFAVIWHPAIILRWICRIEIGSIQIKKKLKFKLLTPILVIDWTIYILTNKLYPNILFLGQFFKLNGQSHRKMATQSHGSKADTAKTARLPMTKIKTFLGDRA